jgi:hypothetical protein
MYINNSGSVTIPSVLPLQSLRDQIYLITGEGRGVVMYDIKNANFPVVGIPGGRGSLLQGPEREAAARGEILPGVSPDAMGRVSPDAFARRMEDEGLAHDVQQILYDPELSTQASNLEALFSDWTEEPGNALLATRYWQQASLFALDVRHCRCSWIQPVALHFLLLQRRLLP